MRATRDQLPILIGAEPVVIISLPAGADLCPCPHWGYMLKGRIRVSYADDEEILRAGDLFDLPPAPPPVHERYRLRRVQEGSG